MRSLIAILFVTLLIACSRGDEAGEGGSTEGAAPPAEGAQVDGAMPASKPPEAAAEPASDFDSDPAVPAKLGVPVAYEGPLPTLAAVNLRNARLDAMLEGLAEPWAFEFVDGETVLITEIRGRLLRWRVGDAEPTAIDGLPPIATEHDQTGLLDLALHPDFARNRRLYVSYAEADAQTGRYYRTVVASAVLEDDRLVDVTPIVEAGPHGWSPSNFGGALAFDAAGFVYVSIGDRSEDPLAQRGDRLQGKILRLHDDGRVPADNPFVDDPAVDDRIFALGVRNPQGLDFDLATGRLYEAEHGPLGGDEVNLIVGGANYGWPVITYGKNYSTADIGEGTHADGMAQPLFHYTPSEAISPLVVYRGALFPEWDGDLLVGALKGKHVSRLDIDEQDGRVVVRSEYPILREIDGRIRDLRIAPDGAVWVLAQHGTLYRLGREDMGPVTAAVPKGEQIYALVCAGCHDTGAVAAPMFSDTDRWRAIAAQGRETVLRHTIEGKGEMPERGLCYLCTDEHLALTVDWMFERAGVDAQGDSGD